MPSIQGRRGEVPVQIEKIRSDSMDHQPGRRLPPVVAVLHVQRVKRAENSYHAPYSLETPRVAVEFQLCQQVEGRPAAVGRDPESHAVQRQVGAWHVHVRPQLDELLAEPRRGQGVLRGERRGGPLRLRLVRSP